MDELGILQAFVFILYIWAFDDIWLEIKIILLRVYFILQIKCRSYAFAIK